MKCEDIRARFSAYLDGELSADEASSVKAHARLCWGCLEELESLRRLDALLQSKDLPSPAPEWTARTLEKLSSISPEESRPFWKRWLASWRAPQPAGTDAPGGRGFDPTRILRAHPALAAAGAICGLLLMVGPDVRRMLRNVGPSESVSSESAPSVPVYAPEVPGPSSLGIVKARGDNGTSSGSASYLDGILGEWGRVTGSGGQGDGASSVPPPASPGKGHGGEVVRPPEPGSRGGRGLLNRALGLWGTEDAGSREKGKSSVWVGFQQRPEAPEPTEGASATPEAGTVHRSGGDSLALVAFAKPEGWKAASPGPGAQSSKPGGSGILGGAAGGTAPGGVRNQGAPDTTSGGGGAGPAAPGSSGGVGGTRGGGSREAKRACAEQGGEWNDSERRCDFTKKQIKECELKGGVFDPETKICDTTGRDREACRSLACHEWDQPTKQCLPIRQCAISEELCKAAGGTWLPNNRVCACPAGTEAKAGAPAPAADGRAGDVLPVQCIKIGTVAVDACVVREILQSVRPEVCATLLCRDGRTCDIPEGGLHCNVAPGQQVICPLPPPYIKRRLYIEPGSFSLNVGEKVKARALLCGDSGGGLRPQVCENVCADWGSTDPKVVVVSEGGAPGDCHAAIAAVGEGAAELRAHHVDSRGIDFRGIAPVKVGGTKGKGRLFIEPPKAELATGQRIKVHAMYQAPGGCETTIGGAVVCRDPGPPQPVPAQWKSARPEVATVSGGACLGGPQGCTFAIVQGVAEGETDITATFQAETATDAIERFTATMHVTVTAALVTRGRLWIEPSKLDLRVRQKAKVQAMFEPHVDCPEGAACAPPPITPVEAQWASIDGEVAEVTRYGSGTDSYAMVQGRSQGDTKLVATFRGLRALGYVSVKCPRYTYPGEPYAGCPNYECNLGAASVQNPRTCCYECKAEPN